uniref:amine sulfotransferase-like isoform X2 n=1 Tax=Oncorhynchus gorbuscha TaxID=8017 RepID=UPI001EAEEABD|nr:amine sulfotransferase-like isoform X2 [Oncorhynchus gorbuscha]
MTTSIRTKTDPLDSTDPQVLDYMLVPHRNFNLINGVHSPDEVDQIQNWEIRDSDIFAVTYPKSGTIWMQQILTLIEAKGDVTPNTEHLNAQRVPWIELIGSEKKFNATPSPRLRVTHLQYKFMPLAIRQKRGKVIYVARNPKDVLVSYYHFHKYAAMLETPKDFNDFFEKFMEGKVFGNCWFEHIKMWYANRDNMNFLYITYEEMIKDLRSMVERMCKFLGKDLTEEQMASVVEHSTFRTMKQNPQANYETVPDSLLDHNKGTFMRKGTIGDWKNHFTVAQSERFNSVFQEKMRDLPLSFTWDINDVTSVT